MIVFLTGYMAVGKSTIGKRLANALDCAFIDLDKQIEQDEGTTIAKIFEKKDEKYFRKRETALLKSLTASESDAVISTGGGVPCHAMNREIMQNSGIVVWLKMDVDQIISRLKQGKNTRPLIKNKSGEELESFVRKHYLEREKHYHRADVHFNAEDFSSERLAHLVKRLESYSK
jgi:shikimate kinase